MLFRSKYSFQRHAFLYHEGIERKVFPCPICQKEFSRPDKMKSHLKTAHDCVIPKADSASSSSAAAAAAAAAAAVASPSSPSSSSPSMSGLNAAQSLLVNPFLNMDATSAEGKLKEADSRSAAANAMAMAMLNPLLGISGPIDGRRMAGLSGSEAAAFAAQLGSANASAAAAAASGSANDDDDEAPVSPPQVKPTRRRLNNDSASASATAAAGGSGNRTR